MLWMPFLLLSPADTLPETDTLTLPEVSVTAAMPVPTTATWRPLESLQSVHQWDNLASVLSKSGAAFVRDYGGGGLASMTVRGTGATHTQVMWEGMVFQSPMNGVADMSLLPAGHFGSVALYPGSNTAEAGAGNVGGLVLLGQPQQLRPMAVKIGLSAGSFHTRNILWGFDSHRERYETSTSFIARNARNDFPYRNTSRIGSPIQRQTNSEFSQYSLMHRSRKRFGKHLRGEATLWLMQATRGIGPSMTENSSDATQLDQRLQSGLLLAGNRWSARAAYVYEFNRYQSSLIEPTDNIAQSLAGVATLKPWPTRADANLQVRHQYQWATTQAYGERAVSRHTTDLEAHYRKPWQSARWVLVGQVRQSLVSGQLAPIVPSVTMQHNRRQIRMQAKFSRHYALPSFNDLFWKQADARGNLDLQPERGWATEVGFRHQKTTERIRFSWAITAYSSWLSDMIQWQPTVGIWQPFNLKSVWSRGIEAEYSRRKCIRKLTLEQTLRANFSLATNIRDNRNNPNIIGKQLIYNPLLVASTAHVVQFRRVKCTLEQQYTSRRYTTTDNSTTLDGYYLADASVGYVLTSRRRPTRSLSIMLLCRNLLNTPYQTMAFRPMPGRQWLLSLQTDF